jgi:hypothetical protein
MLTTPFVLLVLFSVNFSIYYNSFQNEFAFDDYLGIQLMFLSCYISTQLLTTGCASFVTEFLPVGIVNNSDVQPDSPFADIWRHDLWGKSLLKIDSHRSYRPLTTILFKVRNCHNLSCTVMLFHHNPLLSRLIDSRPKGECHVFRIEAATYKDYVCCCTFSVFFLGIPRIIYAVGWEH